MHLTPLSDSGGRFDAVHALSALSLCLLGPVAAPEALLSAVRAPQPDFVITAHVYNGR